MRGVQIMGTIIMVGCLIILVLLLIILWIIIKDINAEIDKFDEVRRWAKEQMEDKNEMGVDKDK